MVDDGSVGFRLDVGHRIIVFLVFAVSGCGTRTKAQSTTKWWREKIWKERSNERKL